MLDRIVRPNVVRLSAVSRVFGEGSNCVKAMRDVDLEIDEGEFVVIVGPSGSGKSTCLNILGCLDTPTSGQFRLFGNSTNAMPPERRAMLRRDNIGFVFQSPNLIGRMTALRNVELPLIYRGARRNDRNERACRALQAVGLDQRLSHRPHELSGGQQQRVAIARAVVTSPRLLIADEPTGSLDSVTGSGIIDLLFKLNRTMGLTVVLVTHDQKVADRSPRVCTFRDGLLVSDVSRRTPAYAG
jgi:putative ABC transport system ATP-binding protein